MERCLPTPELHLGLVSNKENDSTVWFLASFPQLCAPSIEVTIHFGLVGIGPVLVPLFFVRLSCGTEEFLLETSLNPYQGELHGLKLLRSLCSQASYQIQCKDLATKAEYTLEITNTHQALYLQCVDLLESRSPWTVSEFVQAQHHLAQSWSTPEERFQSLRQPLNHPSSFSD